jgi:hypothetical protein
MTCNRLLHREPERSWWVSVVEGTNMVHNEQEQLDVEKWNDNRLNQTKRICAKSRSKLHLPYSSRHWSTVQRHELVISSRHCDCSKSFRYAPSRSTSQAMIPSQICLTQKLLHPRPSTFFHFHSPPSANLLQLLINLRSRRFTSH